MIIEGSTQFPIPPQVYDNTSQDSQAASRPVIRCEGDKRLRVVKNKAEAR